MLTQLEDGIWTSSTLLSLGLLTLTRRMTIVRLPCGSLWVHSPNDLVPELFEAVTDLGPVRWLVALNLFHHRAVSDWKKACPEATVIGVPGLPAKKPKIVFDHVLGGRGGRWHQH